MYSGSLGPNTALVDVCDVFQSTNVWDPGCSTCTSKTYPAGGTADAQVTAASVPPPADAATMGTFTVPFTEGWSESLYAYEPAAVNLKEKNDTGPSEPESNSPMPDESVALRVVGPRKVHFTVCPCFFKLIVLFTNPDGVART